MWQALYIILKRSWILYKSYYSGFTWFVAMNLPSAFLILKICPLKNMCRYCLHGKIKMKLMVSVGNQSQPINALAAHDQKSVRRMEQSAGSAGWAPPTWRQNSRPGGLWNTPDSPCAGGHLVAEALCNEETSAEILADVHAGVELSAA